MKSTALAFWIILAVVSATGYGSWVAWQKMHPPERRIAPTVHVNYKPAPPPGPPIKEFELVEPQRQRIRFERTERQGLDWAVSSSPIAPPPAGS